MKRWTFIPLLAIVLLWAVTLYTPVQAQAPEKSLKAPITNAQPSFQPGEELNYRVTWNNIAAAKMTFLTVNGHQAGNNQENSKASYRVEIKLDTIGTVRNLVPINDHFIAYVQPNTGLPISSEREIHEGSKSEKVKLNYNQQKKTVTIVNDSQSAPQTVPILADTHDIASLIWAIRNFNVKDSGGAKLQLFNASTRKLSTIELAAGSHEEIQTRKGRVPAQELIVKIQDGQDGKTTSDKFNIRVWLSDEPSHVPVLITAQPPFGKVRVELLPSVSQNEDMPEQH